MNTEEVVNIFKELTSLMELTGENPFKIRAYEKAIDQLKASNLSFSTMISKLESGTSLGFGPQIIKDLKEIGANNSLLIHQELLKIIPRSQLELLNIRGLGPKKIVQLQKELKIASIDELESALKNDALNKIKGFGAKTLVSLKENLDFYLESQGQFLISTHEAVLDSLLELKNLHIIPVNDSLTKNEIFIEVSLVTEIGTLDKTKSILKSTNIELSEDQAVPNLFHFKVNNTPVSLRAIEKSEHFSLSQLQEDFRKTCNLSSKSLKGILHMHSTYSDGVHSIKELAEEAIRLGYTYIGISDHSQSAGYAGGLRPDDIKAQHIEIDRLNKELAPFRIFKGIESDILADGSLDYTDKVLSSFDFVIASVHSGFTQSQEEMTSRIVRALKNPYTRILGHPTGRLLLKRKAYDVNLQEVLKVARDEGVVVEINSNPKRLDVSWEAIKMFGSCKNSWTITPDAHSKEQLGLVKYGIMLANKAGVKEEEVLNSLGVEEIGQWMVGM